MNDEMIICGCLNVSVGDIKTAIHLGDRTFEEVVERTRACTICMACEDELRALINELVENA